MLQVPLGSDSTLGKSHSCLRFHFLVLFLLLIQICLMSLGSEVICICFRFLLLVQICLASRSEVICNCFPVLINELHTAVMNDSRAGLSQAPQRVYKAPQGKSKLCAEQTTNSKTAKWVECCSPLPRVKWWHRVPYGFFNGDKRQQGTPYHAPQSCHSQPRSFWIFYLNNPSWCTPSSFDALSGSICMTVI